MVILRTILDWLFAFNKIMILKRTLTRKSILGFGYMEIRDLSVQMILDINRGNELISAYYRLDKINFTEDILDELGITDEFRIEKPGKNYEMCDLFFTHKYNSMNDIERMKNIAITQKSKNINSSKRRSIKYQFRKDVMRAKNNGNK